MNLLTTRIAVVATGLLIPGVMPARDKAILMQDYSSDISVTKVESYTVRQQVGSPLGVPVMTEGKNLLQQGMFAFLTGTNGISTGIDMNYSDNNSFGIAYDSYANSIRLAIPEQSGKCRLTVTDAKGSILLSELTKNGISSVKLPHLAPGIYMATAKTENSSIKTIKFVIK